MGYAATPEAGGDAVDKSGRFDPPVKDANNIGTAGKVDPKSWCCGEGSVVSRAGISYLAMMPAPVVVELSVKPRY